MIQKFITLFDLRKDKLQEKYAKKHPKDYLEIVKDVVGLLHAEGDDYWPDPEGIKEISTGDYQGTNLYVIPSDYPAGGLYWYARVFYGSCSGCDTLEGIRSSYELDEFPNVGQVADYLSVALSILQEIRQCYPEKMEE